MSLIELTNLSIKCKGITQKGITCRKKSIKSTVFCNIHTPIRLEKPEECAVCYESLKHTEIPLSCGHWIHRKCVIKSNQTKCPLCRQEISISSQEKNQLAKTRERELNTNIDITGIANTIYNMITESTITIDEWRTVFLTISQ